MMQNKETQKSNGSVFPWILFLGIGIGIQIGFVRGDLGKLQTQLEAQQSQQQHNLLELHEKVCGNDVHLKTGELTAKMEDFSSPNGEQFLYLGPVSRDGSFVVFGQSDGKLTPYYGDIGQRGGTLNDGSTGDQWSLYFLYNGQGQKEWFAKHRPDKIPLSPSFAGCDYHKTHPN
jgi:hypothetical protein